jgi:hypothetical protein
MITKRDIQRAVFERQEQQHWNKIINARSNILIESNNSISGANIMGSGSGLKCSVRHKKTIQLDEGKNNIVTA